MSVHLDSGMQPRSSCIAAALSYLLDVFAGGRDVPKRAIMSKNVCLKRVGKNIVAGAFAGCNTSACGGGALQRNMRSADVRARFKGEKELSLAV